MSAEGSRETVLPLTSLPGAPEQTYLFPKPKGHSRSVSHGGTPTLPTPPRPSVLKSASRGHQRALSQGQIGENPKSGHSRTGSKTDFILPPGHRDGPPVSTRPSARVHSRQASRTDSIYTLRRTSVAPPWRRAMFWMMRRELPVEEKCQLVVVPNHMIPEKTPKKEHPNGSRCDNTVRTTKYTLLSFIPKNLLEQFHRVANLYFIFMVLLNWIPVLQAFAKELASVPVLFVLGVTALKDLVEDRRRHISDKKINNSLCRVYKKSLDRYIQVKWRDVRVGDIVHLSNNEAVPADIVLLRSSDKSGLCYIDTCNLDGETNLKQRYVAPGFKEKLSTFVPSKFVSVVEVDRPSTKIYRFYGTISHEDGRRVPLNSDNLLLRECFIKNTDYIEGIVVYAGHETKAMLNNGGPRYKRSTLESSMNTDIIWCILVLFLLCVIGSVGCVLFLNKYTHLPSWPLFIVNIDDVPSEGGLIFWTYVIVLQVMIPISLYVTIEMTKVLQVYHIHNDVEMYDPITDTRAQCRALNITEELGQVRYLFSDKTGTLTENKMIFRRCTIDGVDYDHPPGPPAVPSSKLPPIVTPLTHISPNPRMLEYATSPPTEGHAQRVREFLVVLAVCNTVVVGLPHVDSMKANGSADDSALASPRVNGVRTAEKYARLTESRSVTPSPPPETSTPRLKLPRLCRVSSGDRVAQTPSPIKEFNHETTTISRFEAESPDELALAEAALAYNVELRSRTPEDVELGLIGELTRLRVLRVQQFDATRKCMSIALRASNGQVVLYVKGADSTILNALIPVREGTNEAIVLKKTKNALSEYSRQGLRTLVIARRMMTARAWEEWLSSHITASEAIDGRERKIRESLTRLESGLTLLGATGVEDRLQESVPRTIQALLEAGIIIWVLTGDKPETAINVAYAASLFSVNDRILQLMARDKDQAETQIQSHLNNDSRGPSALVVDGKTLTYILDRRSGLVAPFLSLAKRCSAVLCCRATPLQKAYIVKAVKEELGVTTLAIGDGANDVSMIQIADVGIGLSGQEGKQAVMASDFALSRFKYLQRLLLVHGHWCYDRLARMILYFFLKNATFVFLIFWYQLFNGFSAQVMIEQVHIMAYNMIFTAIPPIAIGAYDRIAPDTLLMDNPGLYGASRKSRAYRPHSYWIVLAESLYISLVIFFSCLRAYEESDIDIWQFGLVNMTCCLVTMTAYVAVETRSWTILHMLALTGSLISFFVVTLMFHTVCKSCFGIPSTYWILQMTFPEPSYWLLIVLTTVLSLLPRVTWHALRNSLHPGALRRAVQQRRRLPHYAAHYHTDTHSTHLYRSTAEDQPNHDAHVTAVT